MDDSEEPIPGRGSSARRLAIFLRVLGFLDLLALVAVLAPRSWIVSTHASLGLGEFPDASIAFYLARTGSAMYALHGATVVYLSFDVKRYWSLIRFLAWLAVLHGILIIGVDMACGMPAWWRIVEGPSFAFTGLVALLLQRGAKGDE